MMSVKKAAKKSRRRIATSLTSALLGGLVVTMFVVILPSQTPVAFAAPALKGGEAKTSATALKDGGSTKTTKGGAAKTKGTAKEADRPVDTDDEVETNNNNDKRGAGTATNSRGMGGGMNNNGKTPFRVFQTLPREPTDMSHEELETMYRTLRTTQAMIFAPSSSTVEDSGGGKEKTKGGEAELALDIYAPSERREYLVRRGNYCHPRRGGSAVGGPGQAGSGNEREGGDELDLPATDVEEEDTDSLQWYDVLSRYDSLMSATSASSSSSSSSDVAITTATNNNSNKNNLPPAASSALERAAIELFKFCVLYNGDGHAYWGWDEVLLVPFRDVVGADVNYGVVATGDGSTPSSSSTSSAADFNSGHVDISSNGDLDGMSNSETDVDRRRRLSSADANEGHYVHESFLAISPYAPATSELSSMIRLLLETSDDVLASNPLLLPREFHRLIVANQEEANNNNGDVGETGKDSSTSSGATWTMLRNKCIPLGDSNPPPSSVLAMGVYATDTLARRMVSRCPLSEGGYCCLAFMPDNTKAPSGKEECGRDITLPVMALRNPVGGSTSGVESDSHAAKKMMPYALVHGNTIVSKKPSPVGPSIGGVAEVDLAYIASVRLVTNNTSGVCRPGEATKFPSHPADAPNFFDMLFMNDCLPYRKECHRCLKKEENEKPEPGEPALTTRNACSKCRLECPCYCDVLCKVRPPPKPITRTYSVRPPQYRKEPERLVPKIIHQTWFEPVTKDKYPNMSRLIESWKKSGWEYYFYDDDTAGDFLGTHFPPEIKEAYESITPGAFKADLFRYCVLLIRGGIYADMDVLLQTNLDEAIANDVGFMTPLDKPGDDIGHRSCLWNGLIASAPGHPFLARTIEIVVNNIRNRFTAVDYDDMLCPNPILSVTHTVDTLFTCGPCIMGAAINNLLQRHMQTEFEIGDVDIWRGQLSPVRPDDPRLLIPGRTIILLQNKNDMGAHRFTWADRHLIVAATDMPDYDDRPPSKEHYSKTHEKAGVYGMRKLYTDTKRANEEIRIVVEKL